MARGTFSLSDVDRGWKSLLAAAERQAKLRGSYAKAGMIGEAAIASDPEHQGEGEVPLTNVQLMAWHEFGIPGRLPSRSVIRATFDKNRELYHGMLRALVGHWFDQKGKVDPLRALGIIGLKMVSDMKSYVLEGTGVPPPLAPATILAKLRKGKWKKGAKDAPRALVDTGRMLGAMSHAVETGAQPGGKGGVVAEYGP